MKSITTQIAQIKEPVSLFKAILGMSLEEIENDFWGKPTFPSHLVTTCHKIRTLPLKQLTIEHLRMAIGQKMSLPYLVPIAVEKLTINPLAEGTFYEGDLLQNVLMVGDEYFEWDKSSASSMSRISKLAAMTLRAKELEYSDDELLDLIDVFYEKYK